MTTAVIADKDQFFAFLASQPLCQWAAQKQREIDQGIHHDSHSGGIHKPAPKNDNADLAAALSSMA